MGKFSINITQKSLARVWTKLALPDNMINDYTLCFLSIFLYLEDQTTL